MIIQMPTPIETIPKRIKITIALNDKLAKKVTMRPIRKYSIALNTSGTIKYRGIRRYLRNSLFFEGVLILTSDQVI